MDRELAAELKRRGIPSVDNSANLNAWNSTCLQRHIGRVRHERLLGLAALVAATPFMMWAFLAGMGKLCGWFFDLCELLFYRVLTPLLEHILSGSRKSGRTGPTPRPARRRK